MVNLKKVLIVAAALVLILLVCGVAVSIYRKGQFESVLGDAKDQNSYNIVLKKLGEHMLLPTSTPNIGTVVDIEKLRTKSDFFKDAKNGDTVVIFSDRAIIYDQKQDKIVNVGLIPNKINQASSSAETK